MTVEPARPFDWDGPNGDRWVANQARLDRMLAGRVAGQPVDCISRRDIRSSQIVDRTAIVSAVGPVEVSQSEHVYFASDSIALRCTWRFGANAVHPNRLGKFTVTAPA